MPYTRSSKPNTPRRQHSCFRKRQRCPNKGQKSRSRQETSTCIHRLGVAGPEPQMYISLAQQKVALRIGKRLDGEKRNNRVVIPVTLPPTVITGWFRYITRNWSDLHFSVKACTEFAILLFVCTGIWSAQVLLSLGIPEPLPFSLFSGCKNEDRGSLFV